jgi:hypothetical protein
MEKVLVMGKFNSLKLWKFNFSNKINLNYGVK